jgi:hypothetical protein
VSKVADLNPESLSNISEKIRAILEEAGIEVEKFNINILVTKDYYEAVKNNFPDRPPIDMTIGVTEVDWAIQLLYSLHS